MKKYNYLLLILIVIFTFSCKSNYKPIFNNLNEFEISEGYSFISQIETKRKVEEISKLDLNKGEEYRINKTIIFIDTTKTYTSTRRNYKDFAKQINIDDVQLLHLLKTFDKMNVSEYYDNGDFLLFPVEKYALSKQNGYIFEIDTEIKIGDILNVKNGYVYGNKIIITKKIDSKWCQYESLN